jgi:hypothetical protein
MHRCTRVLLVVVPLIASTLRALADDYPPPIVPEAAKAPLVANLLRGKTFEATGFPPDVWGYGLFERETPRWCEAALESFRNQTEVVHIEPITRAERYSDPVFKPWQSRCPNLAMNATLLGYEVARDPADARRLIYADVTPKGTGEILFGTRNFTLYKVDIDNDARNGEEMVFFSERAYSSRAAVEHHPQLWRPPADRNWNDILPPEEIGDDFVYYTGSDVARPYLPSYNLLDFDRCTIENGLSLEPRFDHETGRSLPNLSGIVRYQGRYYLYEVDGDEPRDPPSISFSLYRLLRARGEARVESICWMREVHPNGN